MIAGRYRQRLTRHWQCHMAELVGQVAQFQHGDEAIAGRFRVALQGLSLSPASLAPAWLRQSRPKPRGSSAAASWSTRPRSSSTSSMSWAVVLSARLAGMRSFQSW